MKATVLERENLAGLLGIIFLAFLASVVAHVLFVITILLIPIPEEKKDEWVEMVVAVDEPPPVIEELPPEPPKVEPVVEKPPEPVDLEDIPPPPPEDTPPPPVAPTKPVRRLTQGVSADSIAKDSKTGFDVRQGNTAATKATSDLTPPEGEYAVVPYTRVTKAPKLKNRPPLDVPQEVIDAEIEGRVEVELTLSPEGKVTDVVLVSGLQSAADAACIANARKTRWEPYLNDGKAAAVKGVPLSCRFEKIED